jgi:hypothetical protein
VGRNLRSAVATFLALATAVLLTVQTASAGDPPPVVLGPPPLVADVSVEIWQAPDAAAYASHLSGGNGVMRVYLTKAQPISRDVVRVCNVAPNPNRVKVEGTSGNRKFKVGYRRKGHNITHMVVAGTLRTRRYTRTNV